MQTKDKTPEYPRDNGNAVQGDTDLVKLTIKNLRGKNGVTGLPFNITVSQSEGVQPSLTEFDYCKENGRFGIEGNLQSYAMVLRPDVKLQRTKVRRKLDDDPKLRKAVKFTSDLLQLWQLQSTKWGEILCTPEALYQDLIKMGYDWEVLLDTRDYWVPVKDEADHLPFLSIVDLLRMRQGVYIPYWFSEEQKATIKPLDFAEGSKK